MPLNQLSSNSRFAKKKRLVGWLLALTAAGLFFGLTSLLSPPAYHGKSISYWLSLLPSENFIEKRRSEVLQAIQQLGTNTPPRLKIEALQWKKAVNNRPREWEDPALAIRALGAQAIPKLLSELQAKEHPSIVKMSQWFNSVQSRFHWDYTPASSRWRSALDGFHVLGLQAKPAIPALLKLLNSGKVPFAAAALACIGPEAIPSLNLAMTNQNPEVRASVAYFLRTAGPTEPLAHGWPGAVAILESGTRDDDVLVRQQSILSLGYISQDAPRLIPLLLGHLKGPDVRVQQCAAASLGFFGPCAVEALPYLSRLTNDPNKELGTISRNSIRSISANSLDEQGREIP